jgi:hypothetical protein
MFNNNNRDNRVDFIEQKLAFFEGLSKEMSVEFKKVIEKLVENNAQVATLVTKQDLRINTLDINAQTIASDLKDISQKIDAQNLKQDNNISMIHINMTDMNNKLVELYNFRTIVTWSVTALVFFLGIAASAGWLSPEKLSTPKPQIQEQTKVN